VRFDNTEGAIEDGSILRMGRPGTFDPDVAQRGRHVAEALNTAVASLLEQGHTVVLIYPIPEVGWDVPDEVFRRVMAQGGRWPLEEPVTTSSDVYHSRNQLSFEALDAVRGERVIRIYPHTLFCDTEIDGRCVTHSESELYYVDDNHLSPAGAYPLVALILEAIEPIVLEQVG
jgi:hypothetical protein